MPYFSYKHVLIGITSLAALLLLPNLAVGQSNRIISLSASPQFPAPHEEVNVSVIARTTNLNNKQIVWRQDGEVIASGIGIDEVTVDTGAIGAVSTVTFQVIIDSSVVERSLQITSTEVDLVWEAVDSYTPPFYEGKALHPGWGTVQVTAIPNIYKEDGSKYRKNELVYTWEYNGLVFGDDSGRGQSSFSVNSVPRRGNTVSVDIETPSGERVASESVTIPISNPEVRLYQYSPLLGTQFNQALTDVFQFDTEEVELVAYPYFFLVDNETTLSLSYEWEMNGDSFTQSSQKNLARFRRQENVSGEARVTLEVDDTSRIFPAQDTSLILEF